jgi:hypothetical protein
MLKNVLSIMEKQNFLSDWEWPGARSGMAIIFLGICYCIKGTAKAEMELLPDFKGGRVIPMQNRKEG